MQIDRQRQTRLTRTARETQTLTKLSHVIYNILNHDIDQVFHTAVVWIVVALTFERYIAICRPFLASTWCSQTSTRRILFAIFVGSILFSIPR